MSFLDIYNAGSDTPLTFKRDTLAYEDFIALLDELAANAEAPTVNELAERLKKQATPGNYKMLCDCFDLIGDTEVLKCQKEIDELSHLVNKRKIDADVKKGLITDPENVERIQSALKSAGLMDLPTNKRPHRTALLNWLLDNKKSFDLPNKHDLERLLVDALKGIELPVQARSASQNIDNLTLPKCDDV